MLSVFREAVRIGHLDMLDDWPLAVGAALGAVIGLPHGHVAVGVVADLVRFSGRDWNEWLSRLQSDRVVLRAVRPIDTTPPDYRELDTLFTAS